MLKTLFIGITGLVGQNPDINQTISKKLDSLSVDQLSFATEAINNKSCLWLGIGDLSSAPFINGIWRDNQGVWHFEFEVEFLQSENYTLKYLSAFDKKHILSALNKL